MKKTAMHGLIKQTIARRSWIITLTVLALAALSVTATAGLSQTAFAATTDERAIEGAAALYAGAATEEYAHGEPAKYSLSSIQGGNTFRVQAGQATVAQIAFYNIDGNRSATIDFQVTNPQGWSVEIVWPGHTTGEALTVWPGLPVDESPALVPEGARSIFLPGRGYVLARVVEAIVEVPKGATEQTAMITMTATAAYGGQGGAASIAQTREFNFNIQVLAPDM